MNKKILPKLLIASVLVGGVNFLPVNFAEKNLQIISVAHAKVENVTASGKAIFNFGEDDEKIVATVKNVAKMRAEQAAKEKAGIYIKSQTKIVNNALTDDDISAYTSNNIEILNTTYKKIPVQAHDVKGNDTGEIAFMYEATVTAKIDTADLQNFIQRDDKENIVQQNKISQENISKISQEFDNLNNSSEDVEQIKFKLVDVNSRILAEEKLAEGNKFFDKKDYQGAIEKYTESLKINPNRGATYYNRALCYDFLKNYSQAIKDYTEAITFNGSDLNAYYNRGVIYVNLKNFDAAIEDFNKIISLKSDYEKAYNGRGVVNFYLQNYSASVENFTKVIQLGNNKPSAYGNRGIAYTKLKNYQKALEDLNKSVQCGTTDGEVYFCRGICNKELGNNLQAEKDFAKARELGYKE